MMNGSSSTSEAISSLRRASIALLLLVSAAHASTVNLTGQPGSNQMTYSYQYVAPLTTPTVSNDYAVAIPGFYTFTDSLSPEVGNATLGTSNVGSYNFQDSYRFTLSSGASGDSLIASLGFGNYVSTSNLQFRLYQVPTATTAPVLGNTLPAGSRSVASWMGPTGADTNTTDISATFSGNQLVAGTYILDVAGLVTGSIGGSYLGSLNLAPVPLPATAWLLLSGFGGLGFAFGKRGRSVASPLLQV